MMHELSICQALLIRVAEIAAVNGAAAVERVTIEIGALAGVDPARRHIPETTHAWSVDRVHTRIKLPRHQFITARSHLLP